MEKDQAEDNEKNWYQKNIKEKSGQGNGERFKAGRWQHGQDTVIGEMENGAKRSPGKCHRYFGSKETKTMYGGGNPTNNGTT